MRFLAIYWLLHLKPTQCYFCRQLFTTFKNNNIRLKRNNCKCLTTVWLQLLDISHPCMDNSLILNFNKKCLRKNMTKGIKATVSYRLCSCHYLFISFCSLLL